MNVSADVAALIREMDASQQAFDQWATREVDAINSMAKEKNEQLRDSQRELSSLEAEKLEIERRISQLKSKHHQREQESVAQQQEHVALRKDLEGEAKALKSLGDLCFLLQKKRDRVCALRDESAEIALLQAFETLYGLSVSRAEDSITFTFQSPEATVTIQEDENRNFRLAKAPVALTKVSKHMMSKFNENQDLLTFLSAVRQALLTKP
jgi:chromosome segregation ATPase